MNAIETDAPTLLVVEDDTDAADLLGHLFEVDGYRVLRARDGALALDLAKENDIAAALVDLELPWMDGRELIRALRGAERTRNMPILVVSGAADARAVGADDVVEKPLSGERLRTILARIHAWAPLPPDSAPVERFAA